MGRTTDESFPKSLRIRKRAEYLVVQDMGQRVQSKAFVGLLLKQPDTNQTRLGITTTKRLGCAVVRNKTRRLVREAFRRGILKLPDGIKFVVIAKKKAALLSSQGIFDDLSVLGIRATHLVENPR